MAKIAQPVVRQKARLGEGALWPPLTQTLYWVDITGQCVFIYDPKTNNNHGIQVGKDVSTIVPRASGGVLLAVQDGIVALDLDKEQIVKLISLENDLPNNRFNDGKCDPAGRFWVGSMAYDFTPGAGALYCIDPDLSVRKMIDQVGISNGLAWAQNAKKFYYIDSLTSQIVVYDYDVATGEITNRQEVVEIPAEEGFLDGMTIDENDNLWVAIYKAGEVRCWDPSSGALLDKIKVPGALLTTSCAFGGPDMNELYITTASDGLSEEEKNAQPEAGSLFKVKLDVKGQLAFEFAR